MSAQVEDALDLSGYTVDALKCHCGADATLWAKGCMDAEPVALCEPCLRRGLDVVRKFVQMHQKHTRRVMICGDCYRPILTLETHLDVWKIPT